MIAGCTISYAKAIENNTSDDENWTNLKLWYRRPAKDWETQALPIGNGRLGAMVFGRVKAERIQLNEDTLWGGYFRDATNPQALAALPEVRRLVFEGKHFEAKALMLKKMIGIPSGVPSYQSLGDLHLEFAHTGTFTDYRRSLDLDTAITEITYTINGVRFRREVFASVPDNVVVVHITASRPGSINCTATMTRKKMPAIYENKDAYLDYDETGWDIYKTDISQDNNRIILCGQINCKHHETGKNVGMRYESHVLAKTKVGRLSSKNGKLKIEGANELLLLIAAATDYRGRNPTQICRRDLELAKEKSYKKLRDAHIADHRSLFRRVAINLGKSDNAELPTDEHLASVRQGKQDPELTALCFQFGRYLLMASSRPGCMPANIQGIWNELLQAWNDSDYHLNINLQMIYWPTEVCNLAECHLPLFDWMEKNLVPSGCRTAKVHYGCRGWVAHHLSDLWGYSAPACSAWPTGGALLCDSLWEHYAFGGNREFLKNKAYPIIKGATEFFLDYLIEEPTHKWLVTCPSRFPEHGGLRAGKFRISYLVNCVSPEEACGGVLLV